MKLASYAAPTGTSYGLVDGEQIVDLKMRIGSSYPDLKSLIEMDAIQAAEKFHTGVTADYHRDEVTFLPTIPDPARIYCIGLNYHAHREEGGRPEVKDPTVFMRIADSQVGHRQPLVKPLESDNLDYEGEIAVIIGKPGRRIPETSAWRHVAGYACYNDGSVRDWQRGSSQFTAGKNFVRTGGFGPWMVTADEIPPGTNLTLTTTLNGAEMQRGVSDDLIFPIPKLIAFLSTFAPLRSGDVIVTGTPSGVGAYRDPKVFLKPGDICEITVDKVGTLSNTVIEG
ncbi:fumarylacetoacetate hydrolase family protein [Amorphus orientalis]|uniref:2-keto-4-pentenoate hydratase/2-oxohepta-3-ene-1,7-dioic acid hydratase in catechol pathway n=1 Tax=Amorphus orientalis TaxID=649198 RepID=A0AAE3VNC7_9HYPH|nr:fumarylacetoacetate hydrolase family protein [Amorphus orientalis]MDQ0315140.1 2-keto-4-pentenoate hydratase/2-oxohepta-3-ene-1,7-dioic acid hydratase in catechol pathway [Amorphus orientalis]